MSTQPRHIDRASNEEHASPQQGLLERASAPLAFAPLVAIALLLATPAAAQYSSSGPAVTTESTSIDPAVEDAIDDAADDLYEELFTELSEEVALVTSCSMILEPGHKIGGSCSCTASGRGAACGRTRWPGNRGIRNVWCRDATGVTTCQYDGPRTDPKDSCGCS